MTRSTPFWKQRQVWTVVVALVALAFWIVGLGAGWRGWVLTPSDLGIVAHAQGFGEYAYIWWMPATIISLTAVLMAIGVSVVRHLVGNVVEPVPERAPVEPQEPLEPLEALKPPEPEVPPAPVEETGTEDTVDTTEVLMDDDDPDAVSGGNPRTDPSL